MGSLRFMLRVVMLLLLFLSQKDKRSWVFMITSQNRTLFHCLVTSVTLFATRYLAKWLAKMQSTLKVFKISIKPSGIISQSKLLWVHLAPNGIILSR